MPFLNASVQEDGLIVTVGIAWSTARAEALKRAGGLPVSPIWVTALLDTGASCSVIDSSVVGALKLIQAGTIDAHTPNAGGVLQTLNLYDVCLAFARPQVKIMSMNLPVAEASLANQGFLALIGRDVLQQCLLVYNGPLKSFSISF
jgi:hypothetical protein